MQRYLFIGATLGLVMTLIAPAQAQGTITLDHAVRNCRLIGDREARLSCYDRVIDAANASLVAAPPATPLSQATPRIEEPRRETVVVAPATPPRSETPRAEAVAAAPPPAPPAQPVTVADPVAKAAVSTEAQPQPKSGDSKGVLGFLGGKSADGIVVEIASVTQVPGQAVHVITRDGATWDQIDGTEITRLPAPGDTMTIMKNMFGKTSCKFARESLFDCKLKKAL